MLLLDARTWHFSRSTLMISRYVLPRRRSSSISSQYGSSRERGGLGGKLLRMSFHFSSIAINPIRLSAPTILGRTQPRRFRIAPHVATPPNKPDVGRPRPSL